MPIELIDWGLARRVGRAVAGPGPSVSREAAGEINREFGEHVRRADRLVRSFTGLVPEQEPGTTSVLGRGAWVEANLQAIRGLLGPVAERLAGAARGPARRIGAAALGVQVGILLGYVAQKVLGQYDLLLASGEPGRVYFVGPNIVAAERRHRLAPGDFRLWIALHEITHRTQFLSVPWLRGHVSGLIESYLSGVTIDGARLGELAGRIRDTIAGGPDAWRRANVMSIFLSEGQREAVGRMQSLMTVVEGHGNYVMDSVAATEIPTYARLREALSERRASAGAAERAFQKLIALDLKYEQYTLGQSFFNEVARRAGAEGVNRVWESIDNVPSPDELRDPGAWLDRVSPPRLFEP